MPKNKKGMSIPKKIVIAASVLAIIAGGATVAKRVIDPGEKVTAVIDGDSFKIGANQTIRLFGADAPELQYCYGPEAKDALTKMILGKTVILKEQRTDMYRRIMALVYLDGESVNEYMVKNGFAESHRDAGSLTDVINQAEDFAKSNKVGIFSPKCYQLTPPNSKCIVKGNITQDKGTKIYFVPGCNHYSTTIIEKFVGDSWFCSETEAKTAGFTKSPECSQSPQSP